MTVIIKKYKNRRLYDTAKSLYVTIADLQKYVVDGVPFRVLDSQNDEDLTNSTLLQILVEMETGPSQFFTDDMLRLFIHFANHPMHQSFKTMLENYLFNLEKLLQSNPYQTASDSWKEALEQWQKFFK
jgi:polyhydroxyalkanoate synthesis repressor PhaR